jgi:hypothetical protein
MATAHIPIRAIFGQLFLNLSFTVRPPFMPAFSPTLYFFAGVSDPLMISRRSS